MRLRCLLSLKFSPSVSLTLDSSLVRGSQDASALPSGVVLPPPHDSLHVLPSIAKIINCITKYDNKECIIMARIVKRTGKKGEVSYLIRVSCGYDASGKQITKSKTWHPAPGMSPRQAEKEVVKLCALAVFAASITSSSVASSLPYLMFSITVPVNKCVS